MRNKIFTLALLMLTMVFAVNAQKNTADSYQVDYAVKMDKQSEQSMHKALPYNPDKGNILNEGFETWPPADWSLVSLGDPVGWIGASPFIYAGVGAAFHNDDNADCQDWLITPALTLDSDQYMLKFWEYQNYNTYYDLHKVSVLDGPDPATATELEVLYSTVGTEDTWVEQSFSLAAYDGQTVYIGFYYQGVFADEWAIDNVSVGFTDPDDLALASIMPAWGYEGSDVTPIITVKNVGTNAQDDFTVDVVVNDGTSDVYTSSKSVTGAGLAADAMLDVTMDDVWTSPAAGEYSVTATVTLAGDPNADNNTMMSTYTAVNPTYNNDVVYGFNASDWTPPSESGGNMMGVNVFTGEMADIGSTGLSGMYAGDFIGAMGDHELYGVIDTSIYLIDGEGNAFLFGGVSGMDAGAGTLGMAWDAVTGDVYVTDGNNILYSVAESGGALTATSIDTVEVPTTIIGLASNSLGELYAVTLGDTLYSINKADAVPTKIGYIGVNINYAQDIGFDRTNDILYGTLYLGGGTGGLYTFDLTTGLATQIGVNFSDELTVCAVYGNPQYEVTFNVDDGSAAVDAATINIFNNELTTDASGVATINLIDGSYDYTVTKAGFGVYFGTVTVAGGVVTENVTLETSYNVTFTVDDGTDPIVGASIYVNDFEMGVTDASGQLIVELAAGTYDYAIMFDGYFDATGQVTVVDADLAENVSLIAAFDITFTVVDENTDALAGVNINLNSTDVLTDDAGVAVFTVPAGDYPYTASMAGYNDSTGTISVVDADVAKDLTMTLLRYTVTFNVTNGTDPLEGVNINIDGQDVLTDAAGAATIDLPNGEYPLVASIAGYANVLDTVTVADAAQTFDITFTEPAYPVVFTVDNELGTLLEGASVTIGAEVINTDASGEATFNLNAGDHEYTVSFDGYYDSVATITVADPGNSVAVTLIEEISAPTNLMVTVDSADAALTWNMTAVELSQHSGVGADGGYYQDWGSGYGVVFDLTAYPDATLSAMDFHHVSWGVTGTWDYKIHVVDWDAATILYTTDMLQTTGDDQWETDIDLANLAGHGGKNIGIFLEPFGNVVDDAYPDVNTDGALDGASFLGPLSDIANMSPSSADAGDFIMDLWIMTANGKKVAAQPMKLNVNSIPTHSESRVENTAAPVTEVTMNQTAKGFVDYSIYLDDMMTPVATGVSGNSYMFTDLAAGTYTAGVQSNYETGASEIVTVDFTITAYYTVTLTVTDGTDPIEGATVTINGGDMMTDADGMVSMIVPNGDYPYTIVADGFQDATGTITVADADVDETVAMDLMGYNVIVNVIDGAGTAITGATVELTDGTDTWTETTNVIGTATFTDVINGTYDVTASFEGMTSDPQPVVVDGANESIQITLVGTNDVEVNFSIYPNPTTGILYIQAQGTNEVTILNAIGNVVTTQQIEGNDKIDLSSFANGIYFIRLKSDNSVATQRIILK